MSTKEGVTQKWTKKIIFGVAALALIMVAGAGAQLAGLFVVQVPNEAEWAASAHADPEAEAFTHWDAEGEIPISCAKCHSTPGHLDFLGVDGTPAGVVDTAAPVGTTIECIACHNEATLHQDSVVFPSDAELGDLGPSARCMDCHQGRESGLSVAEAIADANLPDDDTVGSLRFMNIHYYAAGATLMGGEAAGGYQYAGKSYDVRLAHVEGINKCIDCHDPHTLVVKVDLCSTCHQGVETADDLKDIRFMGSLVDYDGDYNTQEGIAREIAGLQSILYGAIRAYAESAGMPITYDAHAYPYFFADENNNDQADEGEGSYGNFTARLLKAVYNYQLSVKDPGAFAHNGKYIIQLLYDSIEDLDPALVEGLHRDDAGHFAGSMEAFRHWDEDGEVSGQCSKCHSAAGLPFFLAEGVAVSQPVSNGLQCTTCHDAVPGFTRREAGPVPFPSGVEIDTGDPDSNLCITCHQGRESGLSVMAAVGDMDPDTVSASLRFINVHYFAAGATRYGTEAWGAYEYPGKQYRGLFRHVSAFNTCTECHDAHMGKVDLHGCLICHEDNIQSPHDIRMSGSDFDGDGDTAEGLADEIATLREKLLTAMQDYAVQVTGVPIEYNPDRYPYFLTDTGGSYNAFTPRLLEAAYNLQFATKDPGAFAHNGKYVIQVLYDGIADLGGNTAGLVRP